jgi:hypothetical protein
MDLAELQKDLGKAFSQIAQVDGKVNELRVALVGIDNNNGLRGELRAFSTVMVERMDKQDAKLEEIASAHSAHEDWQHELEHSLEHYKEVERPLTCIGKAALKEYIEAEKQKDKLRAKEMVELRKTRLTMLGSIAVALIGAIALLLKELI